MCQMQTSMLVSGCRLHPEHTHWTQLSWRQRLAHVQDATVEQIERMNNNCAVCWSEMGPPMPRAPMLLMGAGSPALASLNATPHYAPGKSLICGHAFHEACIKQWLAQCHG